MSGVLFYFPDDEPEHDLEAEPDLPAEPETELLLLDDYGEPKPKRRAKQRFVFRQLQKSRDAQADEELAPHHASMVDPKGVQEWDPNVSPQHREQALSRYLYNRDDRPELIDTYLEARDGMSYLVNVYEGRACVGCGYWPYPWVWASDWSAPVARHNGHQHGLGDLRKRSSATDPMSKGYEGTRDPEAFKHKLTEKAEAGPIDPAKLQPETRALYDKVWAEIQARVGAGNRWEELSEAEREARRVSMRAARALRIEREIRLGFRTLEGKKKPPRWKRHEWPPERRAEHGQKIRESKARNRAAKENGHATDS